MTHRWRAGPDAAIDGRDACRFHGLRALAVEPGRVHVGAPADSTARSRGFVVVRRSIAPISVVSTDLLSYVGPAQAAIAAARGMPSSRSVLAVLSEALQRRITTYDELVAAHIQGPPRRARWTDEALEHLGDGTQSVPEADFRCLDALLESPAVVHETNGRVAHDREDLFVGLQERHDALTAAGFTVLHNPPQRLRQRGREVIASAASVS